MNDEIEFAEIRLNDGDGADYVNIYAGGVTHSYLLDDVLERMQEPTNATLKAEREALWQVAILAINAVMECGLDSEELEPNMAKLDRYLAHEIPEDMWEELNTAALHAADVEEPIDEQGRGVTVETDGNE